jgi:hypothetical protein
MTGWRYCVLNNRDLLVETLTQIASDLETPVGECVNCISVPGTNDTITVSEWTDALAGVLD